MNDTRQITVAAVCGELDWRYRRSCSGDHYDEAVAHAYVAACVARQLAQVTAAAAAGAELVVLPEYAFGAEMFSPIPAAARRALALREGDTTLVALAGLCRSLGVTVCGSGDVDHGERGVHQTGFLIDETGRLTLQVKHPRCVPDPPDWPFDSVPMVYPTASAVVGITVCSDCTHDPYLPLEMSRLGMDVLLLPGCGFMSDKWRSFLVVRARDSQCPVVYADDGRAAIADSQGDIIACSTTAGEILHATVAIPVKKSSPDA